MPNTGLAKLVTMPPEASYPQCLNTAFLLKKKKKSINLKSSLKIPATEVNLTASHLKHFKIFFFLNKMAPKEPNDSFKISF